MQFLGQYSTVYKNCYYSWGSYVAAIFRDTVCFTTQVGFNFEHQSVWTILRDQCGSIQMEAFEPHFSFGLRFFP